MKQYLLFTFMVLIMISFNKTTAQCYPEHLQCEYMVNPLGIDEANPRLKWKINDQREGAIQQAYKISVGTDSTEVLNGTGNMWNSPKVSNDKMLVSYEGKPLEPFTKYFWIVHVWDKDGKVSSNSEVANFETGMMKVNNWKGTWISDTRDFELKPAPYFRKEFEGTKSIKNARVYVAVAGLYELYINGKRIGDHQLDPMYTRFDRRTLYVTYDVTSHLHKEKNAIGVLLGNGWYNHQSNAVWFFHEAPWRARPKFCMDLRITYEDGSEEIISTDKSWKTSLSPIIFNSIYTAEHYDARLEQPGWNKTKFDDSKWKEPILTSAPTQNIVSQTMHPIRNVEDIAAKSIRKIDSKKYIFDLGKNISGVSRIKVNGESGTILRLTHAEKLDSNGEIDQSNIDLHYTPTDDTDPFQTDIYILKGEGQEFFSPRFNYKGFQFVEVVCSKPIELTKESLIGVFMHSDVPRIGEIKSSNSTLNKIWEASNNSYLSNLFGYPTDCPQREKNGWTGDAHIASETGLFNFDGITIYEKWLDDHRDEQQPNGVLPAIIPTSGWGYQWANGPDWTSTIAIIPWNLYLFYGDSRSLKENYENIKRYVDHITEISPLYLTDWGLGDWVPVKSKSPVEFTSSIYYYVDALILSKAANLLKKEGDYEKYVALSNNIKEAINRKYLNTKTGIYGSGFQTELSAALFWGIVPEEFREKVAMNLAKRVIADDEHIDVGLLGTKTILNALSENGFSDLAYKVASKETYPSWGWWIVNGATTLFENWKLGTKSDGSLNHIMFGEIGAWYYKALGGIKPDPDKPGFKNIILEPHFVSNHNNFEARHNGPYGEIISSWNRSDGKIIYTVTIPPNSTATLYLNGRKITQNKKINKSSTLNNQKNNLLIFSLEAGSYEFTIEE